jgi:hypothetical protein
MFWDGMLFIKTEHDVICAPENKNANNPDFFIYWIYGWVVISLITPDISENPFIIDFYIYVISGAFITNQTSCFYIS